MIEPFTIKIDEAVLTDLGARLKATRWPDQVGDPWLYGTDSTWLRELVGYWQQHFDWRVQEARLNRFDHFLTSIDDRRVHFIHQRSKHPDAVPILITHGWPGSVAEFQHIIEPLVDPTSHGGDAADAFHVICPSIPGYGFSEAPKEPGFDQRAVALDHIKLMEQLGYPTYGLQGGDWGSAISSWHAALAPERIIGLHLNLVFAGFPKHLDDPFAGVTDSERRRMEERRDYMKDEVGYQHIQSTKPQTLGFGLSDSPVGLAAWITEKFRSWTDCKGHIEKSVSKDELLTNIMIYWVTNTITSSARLYYESAHSPHDITKLGRIMTPTGCAIYPAELAAPPRSWAEQRYNVTHWELKDRGGHFAALEVPESLLADIRLFFRGLRP